MKATVSKSMFGSQKTVLTVGNIAIRCCVTSSKHCILFKTDVIRALGYEGKSDKWPADILNAINKFSHLPTEILMNRERPVNFQIETSKPPLQIHEGVDARLFLEVCKVITQAAQEGYLNVNQIKYSKAATHILSYFSDKDIDAMICEVTGYNFYKRHAKEHLQQFLSAHLKDESLQWIKTFPDSFFEMLLAMHQLEWTSLRETPQVFGTILFDVVFERISEELLTKLRILKPKRDYRNLKKDRQDNQHPDLKRHLAVISALVESAKGNRNMFVLLLNKTHPKHYNFTTKLPAFSENDPNKVMPLSVFNNALQKFFGD
ncbi:MAG: hypothetical protein H7199_06715 [Burkholderiales bacterium]|nr:hypothetical protein [Flavobacterium sp.]